MRHPVSSAALIAGALLVFTAARPESPGVPDPDLFASAGCASCHGPDAAGAFGPTLAGSAIAFDAFLAQLRSPRGMMPPVDTGLVTDEQARVLFEWVTGLEAPEGGPVAGAACPCGRHSAGHQGAGPHHGPHHQGEAAGSGQGRGRGGACRHGACRAAGPPPD